MNLQDLLDASGAQPIRRVAKLVEKHNQETGEVTHHLVARTDIFLGQTGETLIFEVEAPTETWDCRHPITVPFGGRCVDGDKLCCVDCITRCGAAEGPGQAYPQTSSGCGKPLAREGASLTDIHGVIHLLCEQCAKKRRRKQRRWAVLSCFLNTFFRFDGNMR